MDECYKCDDNNNANDVDDSISGEPICLWSLSNESQQKAETIDLKEKILQLTQVGFLDIEIDPTLDLFAEIEKLGTIIPNDTYDKKHINQILNLPLVNKEIIKKDLVSIFTKNNIKPIECLNKKLDPNLHQAMSEMLDDKHIPGTILQEIQSGYMIGERLLRPALVGVAKNIEKNKDKKERLEVKKHCKRCGKHTLHKESK